MHYYHMFREKHKRGFSAGAPIFVQWQFDVVYLSQTIIIRSCPAFSLEVSSPF